MSRSAKSVDTLISRSAMSTVNSRNSIHCKETIESIESDRRRDWGVMGIGVYRLRNDVLQIVFSDDFRDGHSERRGGCSGFKGALKLAHSGWEP